MLIVAGCLANDRLISTLIDKYFVPANKAWDLNLGLGEIVPAQPRLKVRERRRNNANFERYYKHISYRHRHEISSIFFKCSKFKESNKHLVE